jgi:hypothetical protein
MKSNRVREPAKSCPRCHADRVHRSHRRAALDHLLYALGAEIRRCSACRLRHAAFVTLSVPLREPPAGEGLWTRILVMASGFLVCLLFAWWVIRRFTESSG